MKLNFKRITSSGRFIPEIDGLRFIAIISVVLYHFNAFLRNVFLRPTYRHIYVDHINYNFINQFLERGDIGVPLFFVISGFVLGLPFAKHYLLKEKPVLLKNYFLRRLTRLEPPYILVMTFLLFGAVYIAKTLSFSEAIHSYFASIFYIHNFCYGKQSYPLLNIVAWSLEIEVQFYILAPILAAIFFKIGNRIRRLAILFLVALLFIVLNHLMDLPFRSLINYIQYFLIGFLLVDLYVNKTTLFPKTKFDTFIAFLFFIGIWLFNSKPLELISYQRTIMEIMEVISITFFYYYVLFHNVFKILSNNIITSIGGMCYSIYLIHHPLMSLLGNKLLHHQFSTISFIDIGIDSIITLLFILSISAGFFLIIERPCMKRDWYKYILKKRPTI